MAALKAFAQAVEIDGGAIYCLHRVAMMHHALGELVMAIEGHRKVITLAPRYVASLYDLALSLFDLAKENAGIGLSLRAADCINQALGALDKALDVTDGLQCAWKLLGDICTFANRLPAPGIVKITLGPRLAAFLQAGPSSLLKLGESAFRRVSANTDRSDALADLAINLAAQAQQNDDAAAGLDAVQTAERAVMLSPTNASLWTILGTVSIAAKV